MVDCAINGFIGDKISLSKGDESKPLKNVNTTLIDAILCLFCGFETRESGFLSLNF